MVQNPVKNEVDIIWSAAKAMFILTTSQLQNYQIDCSRYKMKAT